MCVLYVVSVLLGCCVCFICGISCKTHTVAYVISQMNPFMWPFFSNEWGNSIWICHFINFCDALQSYFSIVTSSWKPGIWRSKRLHIFKFTDCFWVVQKWGKMFSADAHLWQKFQALIRCCAKGVVSYQSLFNLPLFKPGFPRWRNNYFDYYVLLTGKLIWTQLIESKDFKNLFCNQI